MVADPRFDSSFGTLEDLEQELVASRLPHALVTSEDFILAYDRPGSLVHLRDTCLRAGYRPTIIAYVRQQVTYAKSLYAMFVVNGELPISFEDFCVFVFGNGVTWGQNRFPFEFETLLQPFVRCFGDEHVIVRSYSEAGPPSTLVHDFVAELTTVQSLDVNRLAIGPRLNEAGTYLSVMEALHGNCVALRGDLESPASIANRCNIPAHVLHEPYDGIDARMAERFHKRFAPHNELLKVQFGITFDSYVVRETPQRELQHDFLRACAQAWQQAT